MLKDTITKASIQAMKEKRSVEKEVLRVALGEIQMEELRSGQDLSDAAAEKLVRKLIKSIDESLERARNDEERGRLELERRTLEAVLPRQLGEQEVVAALADHAEAIRAAGSDGQATGVAVRALKAQGAQVDGRTVSAAVRALRAGAKNG